MFEWSDRFSVGIPSIDAQHQTLFGMAAELLTAMSNGRGKAVTGKILDRLVQYTATHFAHEERLMRLHDYPDLPAHKAQHDALTQKVLHFQSEVRSGRATVTIQLLQFLKSWLVQHIEGSDKEYAPFLKNKAVA